MGSQDDRSRPCCPVLHNPQLTAAQPTKRSTIPSRRGQQGACASGAACAHTLSGSATKPSAAENSSRPACVVLPAGVTSLKNMGPFWRQDAGRRGDTLGGRRASRVGPGWARGGGWPQDKASMWQPLASRQRQRPKPSVLRSPSDRPGSTEHGQGRVQAWGRGGAALRPAQGGHPPCWRLETSDLRPQRAAAGSAQACRELSQRCLPQCRGAQAVTRWLRRQQPQQ